MNRREFLAVTGTALAPLQATAERRGPRAKPIATCGSP